MIEAAAAERSAARLPDTPYVGLVPYDEDDAPFFFGRDEEKQIVAGNLRSSRLTILYGPSGVGKTSLLQAGVVHDLHEQVRAKATARPERAPFAICSFRAWRDDPLPPLAEAIRASALEALGGGELPVRQAGEPFVEALRAWTQRVRTILVVLDQFEDYFLYHPDDDGEDPFAAEFARIVNEPNLRVNFLLSIREDAWAKLDRFEGRIPALFANYVRVEHLDREAAREAIEGPVEEWNRRLPPDEPPYSVESALVEAVVDAAAGGTLALTEGGDGAVPDESRADAVEAPFLQLVMERLWRATVEADARELTLARLEQLGGAQRIVESHLLEALGSLSGAEQATAADLFRFLVTRSKTKIAHPASDLADWTKRPEPEVAAVLDKLCRGESGRILRRVSSPGSEATRYELFHDVLAEPILEWRRGYEQERDRRAAVRRFARIGAILLALVAGFAALFIWALVQRNDATHAIGEARRATSAATLANEKATSLALASAARDQLTTHPDASLLLGLEAVRVRPSATARSSMISALKAARRSGAYAILHGHTGTVNSVTFSPDGRMLASVGFDRTVRFWDARTKQPIGPPLKTRHGDDVLQVVFSPDGRRVATASDDGTVRMWDVRRHRLLGQLVPKARARTKSVRTKRPTVTSVAFDPDGSTLASASSDGTVRLWNVRTRQQVGVLRGGQGSVLSVAFSHDGSTLASGGSNGTVMLWKARTHRPLKLVLRTDLYVDPILSIAFSRDGRTVAGGTEHGAVLLWDLERPEPYRGFPDPISRIGRSVFSVAFSRDGRTLASGDGDGAVQLWDVPAGRLLNMMHSHRGSVYSVAFSPDGRTLASGGSDGLVRLWEVHVHRPLGELLPRHRGSVSSVAFSPDGRLLASGSWDGRIRLWDVRAHRLLGQLLPRSRVIYYSVAFSPDGRTLASGGADGIVRLWDVRTRHQRGSPLRGHRGRVSSVAFSFDGRMLASGGEDGTVRLWDLQTRRARRQVVRGKRHSIFSVAFSRDGHLLASGGGDGTVRLWDVRPFRLRARLAHGLAGSVFSVAFSRDGHTLAGGGGSTKTARLNLRLYDVQTRKGLEPALRGHKGYVFSVAFSRDGRTLASAGSDGAVRLWDVQGRRQLGMLHGRPGPVASVAFSPDDRTLATGSKDGTVRLWEGILWSSVADLKRQVCRLVVGKLTKVEWDEVAPGLDRRTSCRG